MRARTSLKVRLEKESAAHMTVCVSSELAGDHVLRVSSELARYRPRCVSLLAQPMTCCCQRSA